jgi:hypothetical protein
MVQKEPLEATVNDWLPEVETEHFDERAPMHVSKIVKKKTDPVNHFTVA